MLGGRGRTIERCPSCGCWSMAACCGICGPFPAPVAPLDEPVTDLQARAHWGVLEAALEDHAITYRPSHEGRPARWGRGAPDMTA